MDRRGWSAYMQLLKWLQPGASADAVPRGVSRSEVDIPGPDGPFRAWLYRPTRRRASGSFLVAPGLHFLGPADPRLDRFLRVLASAGIVVCAPFLPDYVGLQVTPSVIDDFAAAFSFFEKHPSRAGLRRPGVFSISFGSLPALRLAAHPVFGDQISGLIVFGGYADWEDTIRFCLTGKGRDGRSSVRDPLNQPVVLMNYIHDLPEPPPNPDQVIAAWRAYIEATWGRQEMKDTEQSHPIAERIGATLADSRDRALYRVGCGLESGALTLFDLARKRRSQKDQFLDPRPWLADVRCPVHLFHGADDDVIPHEQLSLLVEAFPKEATVATYLTGLYAHTGVSFGAKLRRWRGAAGEVGTMLKMVRAIVDVGQDKAL